MKVDIVTGLGFGDEGKGHLTEALAHRNIKAGLRTLVIRANGGAQAGHSIVRPDGTEHIFSQVGAAAFEGVPTYLTSKFLFHPGAYLNERAKLARAGVTPTVYMDPGMAIITPFATAANRIREYHRAKVEGGVHGSCGIGIGETMRLILAGVRVEFARMLGNTSAAHRTLRDAQGFFSTDLAHILSDLRSDPAIQSEVGIILGDPADVIERFLAVTRAAYETPGTSAHDPQFENFGALVFEGAQGVLLDEWRGFHPHTTWSTTTAHNPLELIADEDGMEVTRWGVTRTYHTRHGAGPMPTETRELDHLSEHHNVTGQWQHGFRRGFLDMELLRYAIKANGGIDRLAVTHCDRVTDSWRYSAGYEGLTLIPETGTTDAVLPYQENLTRQVREASPQYELHTGDGESFACLVADRMDVPLGAISTGPRVTDFDWG